MANEFTMRREDAALTVTKALHNTAGSDIADAIDLGNTPAQGAMLAKCELEISAPVLAVGALPNAETVKYAVVHGTTSSPTTVLADLVLTQTGAGGVGCAAAKARFKLPSDVLRYVSVRATVSAGGGNCSGSNFTVKLLT